MAGDSIRCVTATVAGITPKTRWVFVEIETAAGLRGVGEASLAGQEAAVMAAVQALAPALLGLADARPDGLPRLELADLPAASAFSAVDQALWDIAGQRAGQPVAALLGPVRQRTIPLYANINRRTLDRSPAGFAASARDAMAAGHTRIKIAPFDEATPEARRSGALQDAIKPGLARIAAVRETIGPARPLMVDCHWRLDEAAARTVIAAAGEAGLHWVECPLPETNAHLAALARLRADANRRGVKLAGCEQGIQIAGFRPFLDAGAYDVMMPDVKYVGGLAEALRLAERMRAAGVAFSPHNPTGPVCHAASMQLCAAVDDLHSLETQFDESPLFDALAGETVVATKDGAAVLPERPGLGVALQPAVLDGTVHTRWSSGAGCVPTTPSADSFFSSPSPSGRGLG